MSNSNLIESVPLSQEEINKLSSDRQELLRRVQRVTNNSALQRAFIGHDRGTFIMEKDTSLIEKANRGEPIEYIHGRHMTNVEILAMEFDAIHFPSEGSVIYIGGAGSGNTIFIATKGYEKVIAVEKSPKVASFARRQLQTLEAKNVPVITGDALASYSSRTPFKAALLTMGVEQPPIKIIKDLDPEEGILVTPVGSDPRHQFLGRFERKGMQIIVSKIPVFNSIGKEIRVGFMPAITSTDNPQHGGWTLQKLRAIKTYKYDQFRKSVLEYKRLHNIPTLQKAQHFWIEALSSLYGYRYPQSKKELDQLIDIYFQLPDNVDQYRNLVLNIPGFRVINTDLGPK